MNQTADMEMIEVTEDSQLPPPPPTANASGAAPQSDAAAGFLSLARQLIDQGKPSQALQAIVMAMRTKGGEEAVFYILQRARELYRSKLQASAEADQLASLFAECTDACETSILAETGRMQIVLDAFSDGSSFICLKCGGLVSNHRKDEHYAYWCQF
uniref:C2HC zinc finger plants domain-containing protein n=1 Tax=Chenopodium quinoa TaxID=63459 RepID=A0A803N1H3_CHEQI